MTVTDTSKRWARLGVLTALALTAAGVAGWSSRATADAVTPWPDVNDPPHANVEWVARDARINGVPTRIEHFDAELAPAEVLAYYRGLWGSATGAAPLEGRQGTWQTLSRLHGPFQILVQVRPRAPQGTEGLISMTNLGEFKRDYVPRDLPKMDHSHVVQVTESVDGPRKSAYVSLVSDQGLDMNLRRYAEAWERRGWTQTEARSVPGTDGVAMHYATYVREAETLDTSFTWQPVERRTYMTVNWVSAAAQKDLQ